MVKGASRNQDEKEVLGMYYTGIDLHNKTSFIVTDINVVLSRGLIFEMLKGAF
jgi:hypothetical protein